MKKHFVDYMYPGILFSESAEAEVKDRNPRKVRRRKGAYAFRFFDREVVKKKGETLEGRNKNYSNFYFFGGQVYTLEDVKKKFANEEILISNMECNGWNRVIKTAVGTFLPFEKGDVVI